MVKSHRKKKAITALLLTLMLLLQNVFVPMPVKADPITRGDEAYIQQLIAAGFPESYAVPLSVLHVYYPSWTFLPVVTGLDWNLVLDKENRPNYSVVPKSSDDSRKSTESWAYDWNTNTWAGFDGTKWNAASREYLAHKMDPRNFLDDTHIFMFEALSFQESQTIEGVRAIVRNTFMDEARDTGYIVDDQGRTVSYAEAFMAIGREYGVSPYHLASRVRQEQGTGGGSSLISGTYPGYEGYYNYFNVSAVNNSNGSAVDNGLAKAQREGWNTRYKSLCGGASLLAYGYIAKGQDTLYFQKFNVVNEAQLFWHQYMSAIDAPTSEAKTVANGYSGYKDQAFTFRIPVYTGMPESAVTFTDTGNPNNYLSSLTITDYTVLPGYVERPDVTLTPAFTGGTTSYSIVVPYEVNSITFSAAAVAPASGVSGGGRTDLAVGNNTILFTCISQSGVPKNYVVSVTRERPLIESSVYHIADDRIAGLGLKTDTADFLAQITARSAIVKVLNADGSEHSGTIVTGNILAVYERIVIPDPEPVPPPPEPEPTPPEPEPEPTPPEPEPNPSPTAGMFLSGVTPAPTPERREQVTAGNLIMTLPIVINGDVNGDGRISNIDIVKMKRHILKLEYQTGAGMFAADANNDGRISNIDIIRVKRFILGMETKI